MCFEKLCFVWVFVFLCFVFSIGMDSFSVSTILKNGGLAVIPTDTIYGVVARALDRKAVERLFAIRRKTPQKPFVILIDNISRLKEFGVTLDAKQKKFLSDVWPRKVSIIFPCAKRKFSYLHLKTNTLAFRLPKGEKLNTLLRKTGPLVAPSANPEGKKPAETIAEAKNYFGTRVDVYIGAGRLRGKPSTVISLVGSSPKVLRQGAVKFVGEEMVASSGGR
ncbi:MAG TPA: threonylcarbamoyl-AMP synthase [Candidatus Taylorbacteria bacterium]|nr:MAG: Sua5/YciO/YrdC/YwlC family protein [Parcubacteria group bacterium GW2011_GWA2_47_64]KKU95379.1 MAG: Sua5/YciO/YrdC/YwlC family protein [Parcubacteria group bacterium GW2011_GWC2_48_17]HBV01709.1 threonylcarbamoyl-AMP synthase [Candidatus Taylorbacteria bacterium]